MTVLSDLTDDLIEEILSRVAITSVGAVRSTCKAWYAFSIDRNLCKAQPKQQSVGFMMVDHRLCTMRFNLHGVLNEDGLEFVDPSIKEIGNLLNQVDISQAYYCKGLLLCVTYDHTRLVIWNPYLGQIKWILPTTEANVKLFTYSLGYDKSNNHKILKLFDWNQENYEIYDFKSNSWKVYYVARKWYIDCKRRGASVNGNTYFWTRESKVDEVYDDDEGYEDEEEDEDEGEGEAVDEYEDEVEPPSYFLICFDFTRERFGQFLPLPFQHHYSDVGSLSCVKEEKLAALSQRANTSLIEIWTTTKTEPNEVLWIPFFKVDIEPLIGFDFRFDAKYGSFFIEEEKKVAVVVDFDESQTYQMAYIIGENGYLKKVDFGEDVKYYGLLVCSSSYVPSLLQIEQIARQKKRERKMKRKEEKRMKKELN